jgi:5-methylcytosine-specific restriction endonuclease McrA
MLRALLLNSDFTPLHFISDWRAVRLFLNGRASIVTEITGKPSVWNESFNTPTMKIPIPATMRLITPVNKKWKHPRFRKKVLFNRDNWQCQYCSVQLHWQSITIDHVLPSSRGGQTSWKNCVASCKSCNKRKGSKTPEEAGMKLRKVPVEPSTLHFWDAQKTTLLHSDWEAFLPKS